MRNISKINLHINDLHESVTLHGDLAIDTEAMGLKIMRDRLCLIQICDSNGEIHMIHFPDKTYNYAAPNLKSYLNNTNVQKIFHFARFDIAIMKHYLSLKTIQNIFCTKIASRFSRTYTESHGLKNIVMDLLGIELRKDQQSTNWGSAILSEQQKNYAARDVIYLHQLRAKLIEMLNSNGRKNLAYKFFDFIDTVSNSDLIGFDEDLFRHM